MKSKLVITAMASVAANESSLIKIGNGVCQTMLGDNIYDL